MAKRKRPQTETPAHPVPKVTMIGEWDDDLIVAALVKVVVRKVGAEMEQHDAKSQAAR
ncbi:MAG: hypothetical protein JWM11_3346 [Planctomycetaceae bacterium]|nr:hypothetical protein [Planctomycetaceae bacterium]